MPCPRAAGSLNPAGPQGPPAACLAAQMRPMGGASCAGGPRAGPDALGCGSLGMNRRPQSGMDSGTRQEQAARKHPGPRIPGRSTFLLFKPSSLKHVIKHTHLKHTAQRLLTGVYSHVNHRKIQKVTPQTVPDPHPTTCELTSVVYHSACS